jgi:hypothetical protein
MRFVLFGLVMALVFSFPAAAFGEDGAPTEEPKKDELGFRERMTLRYLKSSLGLTDEQEKKIEAALIEASKGAEKAIRGALNEEQTKKYDEMKQQERSRAERWGRMGRGGFGGRGGERGSGGMRPGGMGRRGGGMFGNFDMGFGNIINEWKEKLKLDEGQVEKIQAIFGEIMEEASGKFMDKLPELMEGGRFNRDRMRKLMQELKPDIEKYLASAEKKIRKVLREDQLPEFDKAWADLREQVDGFLSGERGRGRDRGRRGDSTQRMLERILRDLALPEDEAEILKPRIEGILKLQSENRSRFREISDEMRKVMAEGADSTVVKEKIDAWRTEMKKFEETLAAKRSELRELLTYEQEAKLLLYRVLD